MATASVPFKTAAAPLSRSGAGARGEGLTLVTEQVAEFGGVERILGSLLELYPEASVVASRFEPSAGFPNGHESVPPGRVQLVGPAGRRRRHYLFPLYARHMRAEPLAATRTVLSLGGMGWASAVDVPAGARHVAYAGGPPRPLWGPYPAYLREYPLHYRPLLRAALPALRSHYRRLLSAPERVAANSRWSAAGMERILGKPVDVIHPPVRTEFFTPAERPRTHYLAVSRLRLHKRLGVVIDAFRELGEPLVIAGAGPWGEHLARSAPPNVRFVGHVDDVALRELYRSSRAIVSASVEEFGLCLVEALACGTPVVAPRAGGSGEIVLDGENGLSLERVDADSIVAAVRALERRPPDAADCRRSADRFSEARFGAAIDELIAA
jgi:glycosyltransferase involved in cell wall biosynthesis